MNPERWQQVRQVFEGAVDLPEGERGGYLAGACGADTELREQVEKLLQTDVDSEDAKKLAAGPAAGLLRGVGPSMVGARVGEYRINRVIGTGGMGTVFEAEQEHPKRVVALKTMRIGLRSDSVRRRFEYESEILGRLRHPRIAQVYGAGTFQDEGSGEDIPYFAMEYVEGARPLSVYVSEAGLDLGQVLELFCEVCAAVQYGHQQGFIHRDLKPANILVDREGQPKIIDFGVARPTEVVDLTMHTEGGQVLGTLQYMSPEQLDLDGKGIDTRVDVYALGVILYELLTGRVPFDLTGKSITEVGRVLKDEQPPRPSTLESPVTNREVSSELDWIVLRAMDKERDRRYGAASELAADIQRYLSHEPVEAGPPSRVYRLRKFVRRNRLAFTAGVAVVVALVAGTTVATLGLMEARKEALTHAAVNQFLKDVLKYVRPERAGRAATVADLMDDAARSVDGFSAAQPGYAIMVRELIGQTYTTLGQLEKAEEQLNLALASSQEFWGETHQNTLTALNDLAVLEARKGNPQGSLESHRRILASRLRELGPDHVDIALSRFNLASMLIDEGEFAEAEDLLRLSLEVMVVERGEEDAHTIRVMAGLMSVLGRTGRDEEASTMGRRAANLARQHLHDRHPVALTVFSLLAGVLRRHGEIEEAAALFENGLQADRELYGEDHDETLSSRNNVAMSYFDLGRYAEAEAEFQAILDTMERRGQGRALDVFTFRLNLGTTLEKQDKLDAAVDYFEESLGLADELLGRRHWMYAALQKAYGVCLTKQGRYSEAEAQLLESLSILEPSFGVESRRVQFLLQALVEMYEAWDKPEGAAKHRARLIGSG